MTEKRMDKMVPGDQKVAQDIGKMRSPYGLLNKSVRGLWALVWLLLFRPTPRVGFHGWRVFLLRIFGAKIGSNCEVYPSCRIWAPWNLTMNDFSVLSDDVDCYCQAPIKLGIHSRVSQYSYLCSASHDYEVLPMTMILGPITIGDYAWVCADVYVGLGVTIGEGAVVGSRSSVYKDVKPWSVVAGNPVRFIRKRIVRPDRPMKEPPPTIQIRKSRKEK